VQHIQGRHLTASRRRIVVDAENVRRSAWPNLSKEELVERCRAWAEGEGLDLLIVFDGDPPEEAHDLVASGGRSADDVIAGLEGSFLLVTSDRALRERVGDRADEVIGGGAFLRQISSARA